MATWASPIAASTARRCLIAASIILPSESLRIAAATAKFDLITTSNLALILLGRGGHQREVMVEELCQANWSALVER